MKFHVADSFPHNFGAAGENFGLRIVTNTKKGLKKVKCNQKKVTKTTDTLTFYWKNFDLFGQNLFFRGGGVPP